MKRSYRLSHLRTTAGHLVIACLTLRSGTKTLPWARGSSKDDKLPWLFLAVLEEEEIVPVSIEGSLQRVEATDVGKFLKEEDKDSILPRIALEEKEKKIPCNAVRIPGTILKSILPTVEELPFLCHVREVLEKPNLKNEASNTSDDDDKLWFSTFIANRFPEVSRNDGNRYYALLLSLEGWESIVEHHKNIREDKNYKFITLYHWSLQSQDTKNETFSGLTQKLLASGEGSTPSSEAIVRSDFLLRMPVLQKQYQREIIARMENGYAALPSIVYSGEKTFAWYRGPLSPTVPQWVDTPSHYAHSAAAMIYDGNLGLFDHSYSAAWQLGRSLALADKDFSSRLLRLRKRYHDEIYAWAKRPDLSSVSPALLKGAEKASEVRMQIALNNLVNGNLLNNLNEQIGSLPLNAKREPDLNAMRSATYVPQEHEQKTS